MARKDDPYLPLYVKDFLTDEKLVYCSAESTGVYIRLMCLMHKSEEYGTILLKQNFKQTSKQIKNFALQLAIQLPYHVDIIERGLDELLENKVIHLSGDLIYQKRMVKDGASSENRAKAGSLGGKKTQEKNKGFAKANAQADAKANAKAKIEANSGNENENRIDNKSIHKEIDNSYLLKEIGGVGERENFIDSQDAGSQNLLPQESFLEPPLQNTTRSEPNEFPLEEKKEEKNHARVVYGGEPAHDSKPIAPDTDSTPKTSRRTNDNLPDGIPIYLKDLEAYKDHLREFYKTFIERTPKSVKFMDEMVNRYDNLDFQKTLKMNIVDYWSTEEGYKTKLKAAKAAVRTNKGKTYEIDWYQTLATSFKYPTNRLYLSFEERMKKKEVTIPPIPPSLPHGYIDLNAPIKRAE